MVFLFSNLTHKCVMKKNHCDSQLTRQPRLLKKRKKKLLKTWSMRILKHNIREIKTLKNFISNMNVQRQRGKTLNILAGDVAQWERPCLACRTWVQSQHYKKLQQIKQTNKNLAEIYETPNTVSDTSQAFNMHLFNE